MMIRPQMVLFDCDGVVVDSEVITNQVIRDDLAQRGLDHPLGKIMDLFVGGTMSGVAKQAASLGAEIPDSWVELIYSKIYEALAKDVVAIEGISSVLDALDKAKIPYAIGSNGRMEKMAITLGKTGLIDRFSGRMYSAQDLDAPKPAPDVYLRAAAVAGISPVHCVVVEDSVSGARAGVAAGMRTLGFAEETPREKLAPICDDIFTSMAQLPNLLGLTRVES